MKIFIFSKKKVGSTNFFGNLDGELDSIISVSLPENKDEKKLFECFSNLFEEAEKSKKSSLLIPITNSNLCGFEIQQFLNIFNSSLKRFFENPSKYVRLVRIFNKNQKMFEMIYRIFVNCFGYSNVPLNIIPISSFRSFHTWKWKNGIYIF